MSFVRICESKYHTDRIIISYTKYDDIRPNEIKVPYGNNYHIFIKSLIPRLSSKLHVVKKYRNRIGQIDRIVVLADIKDIVGLLDEQSIAYKA